MALIVVSGFYTDPPPSFILFLWHYLTFKSLFEHDRAVETNSDGEYVDSMDYKPESPAPSPGSAAADADAALTMSASTAESLKIRDKKGEIRLCFHCHKSALHNRMMASCDHCPLHWHLDCLDPPMASPPPSARKWMCPNHIDHLLVSPFFNLWCCGAGGYL